MTNLQYISLFPSWSPPPIFSFLLVSFPLGCVGLFPQTHLSIACLCLAYWIYCAMSILHEPWILGAESVGWGRLSRGELLSSLYVWLYCYIVLYCWIMLYCIVNCAVFFCVEDPFANEMLHLKGFILPIKAYNISVIVVNTVQTHGPVSPATNSTSGVPLPGVSFCLPLCSSMDSWTCIMDPYKPIKGVTVHQASSQSITMDGYHIILHRYTIFYLNTTNFQHFTTVCH